MEHFDLINENGEAIRFCENINHKPIVKKIYRKRNEDLSERINKAIDKIKGSLYIRDMIEDYDDKTEYDMFVRDLLKDLGDWNE